MYLGVDIGGTKTLAAVLDDRGIITQKTKFPTNPDYAEFLKELTQVVADFGDHDYRAAGVGIPTNSFDRKHGVAISFANLPWAVVPIHADIEKIVGCPVAIENDAKLAGLSEAMLLKDYSKVMYITVSTGIGTSLIVDGFIDTNIGDPGGSAIMLQHHGKLQKWESFASGKAIVKRFGKRAEDIHDKKTWQIIAHDLSRGLQELIAVMQPEIVVFGGSVGAYFERYGDLLMAELKKYETPALPLPKLVEAQRPEEAVVYGCYDYARQQFGGKHA